MREISLPEGSRHGLAETRRVIVRLRDRIREHDQLVRSSRAAIRESREALLDADWRPRAIDRFL